MMKINHAEMKKKFTKKQWEWIIKFHDTMFELLKFMKQYFIKFYTKLKKYCAFIVVSCGIPIIITTTFIYCLTNSSIFMTYIWNHELYLTNTTFKNVVDVLTNGSHSHWDINGFILRWFHLIPFELPFYFELELINYYDPASLEQNPIIDAIDAFSTEIFLIINFFILIIWVLFTAQPSNVIYRKFNTYSISLILAAVIITWFNPLAFGNTIYLFDGWIAMDITTNFMKLIILFFSLCTFISLKNYQYVQVLWIPIFFWVCIITLLVGFMIQHIFALALILEILSFVTIILLSLRNSKIHTNRFKFSFYYLVVNGILSVPMWLGIVFIYGITTNITYIGISAHMLELISSFTLNNELILSIGTNWVTITFLFKLTSAPIAMWVADVYETATLVVLGFLMGTVKFGIFGLFLKFYTVVCLPFKTLSLELIFGIIILASYIFSFGAILEHTIKKIIIFTSVNQIGYILLGLMIGTPESLNSSLVYMLIYTLTITTIFMCISNSTNKISEKWSLNFGDFYQVNKNLSIILIVLFFSLAGIPPFAGFYIKYNILSLAYFYSGQYNHIYILSALISSAILLLVYLQIIISIIRPIENQVSIPITEEKIKVKAHTLPTLLYVILIINTSIIVLFDWVLFWPYLCLYQYLDLLNSVYWCPNSHFIYEYAQFRRYAFFLFFYKNDHSSLLGSDLPEIFYFPDEPNSLIEFC